IYTFVIGDITHTYLEPGIYTVSISGDFPRIYFYSVNGTSSAKIKSVEQWGDIEWTSMESAFIYCDYLTINASDAPDLSQVTNMSYMFREASFFNGEIGNWDVSNVTDMSGIFYGASSFNQPLNDWDVSNVTDMSLMFYSTSFNHPLDNWDVSNVTDMSGMFNSASSFNQPLDNWNVSNVTNMSVMFNEGNEASSFNQPL